MTDIHNSDGPDAPEPSKPRDGDVVDRLVRTHVTVVESGLRYVSRWADLSATAYPLAVRALMLSRPATSDTKPLDAAMDDLRETVREMAVLPFSEAGRLQAEIMRLWS